MTGCPGERDVEFTIKSKHNDGYHMYKWTRSGEVQGIQSSLFVMSHTDQDNEIQY